ncbi:cyclic AMP-dependent transcription factor ATF-4-like [Lepisosteus oculatus]|uniref:cyclic AMP-dependent transcription factor ATF-4-like n=1 Tax=Lepisosteus oculatus TaxID=7918 RepID=UPI0035F51FF1
MDWSELLQLGSLYPELASLTAEPDLPVCAELKEERQLGGSGGFVLCSDTQSISEMEWMGEKMDVHLLDSLIEDAPVTSKDLLHVVEKTLKFQADVTSTTQSSAATHVQPKGGGRLQGPSVSSDQVAPCTPPLSPHFATQPATVASSHASWFSAGQPTEVLELPYESVLLLDGLVAPSGSEDNGMDSECDDAKLVTIPGAVPWQELPEPPANIPLCIMSQNGSLVEKAAVPSSSSPGSKCTVNRKHRKKEQNKNAATRYREKKRAQRAALEVELLQLEDTNRELKEKVASLATEIQCLEALLEEVQSAGEEKSVVFSKPQQTKS